MRGVTIETATSANDEVRALVAELDRTLGAEYAQCQQHGLRVEELFLPGVRLFIARLDGVAMGCGGVAFFDGYAEVKRMYVRGAARGRGLARALLAKIETETLERDHDVLRLETGDRQFDAIRLYERAGFTRCEAFGPYASMEPGSIATSLFYEKRLGGLPTT